MAVNIGPRIGIEGEAEYRKQINNITQAQKTLNAEMKQSESAFDKSTSAQQKNEAKAKNLTKQVVNQEKKVRQLKKMTEESANKFGENSTQTLKWKEALADAETELNRLNKELDELDKSNFGEKLQSAGQGLQGIGSKVSSVGDTLTKNVTVPLAAIGAASVAAYNEVDDAMDVIVKKTGATGDELEAMQKSARKIAKTIPTSFEKSAKAVGEVNTRFGITGDALEDLSTYFLEFADLNDTDVSDSIDKVQKSMKAFGVETKDAKKVLDVMNATGQRTGVSMSSLSDSMVKNSASLQEMGLDAYSAIEFLGDLEISGADASTVMMGLKTALKNAAAEGKSLPESLGEFESIMASSASDTEKLNAAVELFGSKAGPAIYEACKNGGLSFKGLSEDATKYFGNVEKTYEGVLGPESKLVTTMNSLKDTGSQVGETLLTVLEPAVTTVGEYIAQLGEWYDSLDKETQEKVSAAALTLGASGPLITAIGKTVEAVGTITGAVGKAVAAFSGFSGASVLGPLAILAGAVGLTAWSIETSKNAHIEGYEEWIEKMGQVQSAAEEGMKAQNDLHTSLTKVMEGVEIDAQPVRDLQTALHDCFDENGSLKDGMGETASMIMGQLNTALGTDLSTDFVGSMDDNKQALQDVDAAVQSYVANLQKAAMQEVLGSDFMAAWQEQAVAMQEMESAATDYETALANVTTTQEELNALQEGFDAVTNWEDLSQVIGDTGMTLADAKTYYENLLGVQADQVDMLHASEDAYEAATERCASATAQVEGYKNAMNLIEAGKPEEAAEAFGKIATNMEEAKNQVQKGFTPALKKAGKVLDKFLSDPWNVKVGTEFDDVKKESNDAKKIAEKILSTVKANVSGVEGARPAAQAAKAVMLGIFTGLSATVGGVTGATTAASTARSSMQSVFNSPLAAKVSSVSGWADAVRSAWSNMQSWFNSNPLVSYVREVKQSQSSGWNWSGLFGNSAGHANGGFITQEQLSWVGEGNKPEVIIPLSSQKRGRALSLYRQTGAILGVGGGGTVNNSTTNMGGINIVINTTPNQNANEIADIVSRKISAQVYSKGAVFG